MATVVEIAEFATGREAFDRASYMARYGHRKWIVWQAPGGIWKAARISKKVFRIAMDEAVGTAHRPGDFYCMHASNAQGERLGKVVAGVWWKNMEAGHFQF